MSRRAARTVQLLLAVCLTAVAAGCAGAPPEAAAVVTRQLGARSGPLLEGVAQVPSGLISNNGGGILAPGTSRLRLLALEDEAPLADALVYLTNPKDEFYRLNGKMVSTTTDQKGAYKLVNGVPAGQPVIVNAILKGNRRIVGFTVPKDGDQQVDLSVASTYVTEYLRARAEREGKSMADFDLARLPGLVAATRQAIASGALAVPDLSISHIPEMNRAYALAVGRNVARLGDAWAQLLARRVLAVETLAGTGEAGFSGDGRAALEAALYRPRQVVVDAEGSFYIADEGNHRIRKVDGDTGTITTIAGTGEAGFSGDGGPAARAQLKAPRTIALDAERNLYIGDEGNARVRKVDGTTGLITTVVGAPAPDGAGGWVGGHDGDGGFATEARIYTVRGLAIDAMGNVYMADSQNEGSTFHTIRKLDVRTGLISTIAGEPLAPGGFAGDGGPATSARLNYPNQLAFDGTGRLLIADTDNHCLRRIDFTNGLISTIAGIGGQPGDEADGKPATETRLTSPYGVAVAPDGVIYFSERGAGRVRAILPDGKIRTIAGGGSDTADGESLMVQLTQPHDLFVERDGNVLVADTRGSRVRRIITKFGL